MKFKPKTKKGQLAYKAFSVFRIAFPFIGFFIILFPSIDWPFFHDGGYLGFFPTLGIMFLLVAPFFASLSGFFWGLDRIITKKWETDKNICPVRPLTVSAFILSVPSLIIMLSFMKLAGPTLLFLHYLFAPLSVAVIIIGYLKRC